ncbi:MAG: vanadium-dependent haloperoxidase [Acidobacteriia bacterium]|nr:vanadium-dependent haloperoxidase [Terriglobia bacterium]
MTTRKARSLIWFIAPFCLALQLNAANAVTDWNLIASTTIITNGGKSPAASAVWFSYSSLAVYDAVNAITGQYRPFYYRTAGPPAASVEAAAAAAAHRVLVNFFPSQQTALDTQLSASLAGITAGSDARDAGVAVGEAAAMAVINARIGDGLENNVPYVPGSGPGAWIPTPPAFALAVTPWLGQMRPFTSRAADDFLPDGPPSLASETWKRDYNLTRLYGGVASTTRSVAETEIGLFWTEHTGQQYARAFNYLVDSYHLGTADSARLMAMLWTGFADAGIACFNAKYKYGFWRPATAVPAGGGNVDLTADPAWLPLGATPAHPEYPAAHGCVTGAVAPLIASFFGTTRVNVLVDSKAFTDGAHQHTFKDTRDLMDEVFWARIYAGFHYYHSLEAGRQLGETVAQELVRNYFRRRANRED